MTNRKGCFLLVENHYDVVIVGGGLAGLSAGARLSKAGKRILLLEKGILGGRALTFSIKGFSFNFGAHAVYGRDTSVLNRLEKELELKLNWKDFSPAKAKYDLGSELSDVPVNLSGLIQTKMVKGAGKIQFVWEILKTLIQAEKGHPHISLKKWLDEHGYREDVKEMMLTLASSNFFTREPDKIPSDVFFNYYKRIFRTNKAVFYIQGGWQVLIDEFQKIILENQGMIKTKSRVQSVNVEDNRIVSISTKEEVVTADNFLFCIPPNELSKLFSDTKIKERIQVYTNYEPSYVMYYDIALSKRIDSTFTYVYDKTNSLFLTDISYYDPTCTPEGGQLIQAVSYLKGDELGVPERFEFYKEKIETLYDKHFEGWRDVLVTARISKQAVVQEIKWTLEQEAMPVFFPEYRNLFFAGDWCKGQGQLSELSFSSAYECVDFILEK